MDNQISFGPGPFEEGQLYTASNGIEYIYENGCMVIPTPTDVNTQDGYSEPGQAPAGAIDSITGLQIAVGAPVTIYYGPDGSIVGYKDCTDDDQEIGPAVTVNPEDANTLPASVLAPHKKQCLLDADGNLVGLVDETGSHLVIDDDKELGPSIAIDPSDPATLPANSGAWKKQCLVDAAGNMVGFVDSAGSHLIQHTEDTFGTLTPLAGAGGGVSTYAGVDDQGAAVSCPVSHAIPKKKDGSNFAKAEEFTPLDLSAIQDLGRDAVAGDKLFGILPDGTCVSLGAPIIQPDEKLCNVRFEVDGDNKFCLKFDVCDQSDNVLRTLDGPCIDNYVFVKKDGTPFNSGETVPITALTDFVTSPFGAGDQMLVIGADGSCKLQTPHHNYTWTSIVDADGNVTYPADHPNPALAGTTVPAVDGVGSPMPAGTVVTSHTDVNGSYASSDCPVITDADFSDNASDLDDSDCHTKVIKRGNDLYAESRYRCYSGRISIVKNGSFISRTTPIAAGSTGASFVLEAEDILSIPNPDPCRCVMFQGTAELSNMAWVSTAHPANLRARTRIFKDGVSYSNQLTGYSHTIENDTAGIPDQVTLATSGTSNKMGACKVAVGETTELQLLVEVQSRVNGNNLNGFLSQNNESMQWRICYTQQACAE